ncbi:MAG: hypothetical protein ACLGHR_06435 [Gammaproteobacteria bacterium]
MALDGAGARATERGFDLLDSVLEEFLPAATAGSGCESSASA